MTSEGEQFVVHRLRAKPVEYTITIRHFVEASTWMMSLLVEGVGEDAVNRRRVASDLRRAAEMIEEAE